MNDNNNLGVKILTGPFTNRAKTSDHDSMSPEEIKEWNAFIAKEAKEEEQRMLDYD